MQYTVVRIEEDIEFGCEERSVNEPVMAIVVLEDENGQQCRVRQVDRLLYDRAINEGDLVQFTEHGELTKVK